MDLSTEGCDKDHCAKMMMKLYKMKENNEHCDFTVKVDGKEIPAHRNILSAGSDYFHAMLSHENVESSSGVVDMKQVEFSSVKSCINFIYTGQVPATDHENCEQLMHAAHIMQLQEVCDGVAITLEEKLSPESFYSTKMIANAFNCTRLVERCNKFALRNFQSIVAEDDFGQLEVDYIKFLIESKTTKASKSIKCKALIMWTNFDMESRKQMFEELFGKIDLAKISMEYGKYLIENEPLVFTLQPNYLQNLAHNQEIEAMDVTIEAPDSWSNGNAIAVFDQTSKSVQAFDPKMKTWTKMQATNDEFIGKDFTAVVIDDMIYVLVFDGSSYHLNYTDTNAAWVRLADRRWTKKWMAAVACEGSIYAFDDSNNSSKTVEKFDPSVGTWSHVTDKPVEGHCTSVVAAGGFIYCIGGLNGRDMADAMKFNSSDSTWTILPSMPNARYTAAAVELNGKIYVIGGFNNNNHRLNIVDCFDTVAETWTTVARINNSRHYFKACVVEGKIFAVGGEETSGDTIEELDPASNNWKVVETISGKDIEPLAFIAINVQF